MVYLYKVGVIEHEFIGCADDFHALMDNFLRCVWKADYISLEERIGDLSYCSHVIETIINGDVHEAFYVVKTKPHEYDGFYTQMNMILCG